jgi:hypothetical protein
LDSCSAPLLSNRVPSTKAPGQYLELLHPDGHLLGDVDDAVAAVDHCARPLNNWAAPSIFARKAL